MNFYENHTGEAAVVSLHGQEASAAAWVPPQNGGGQVVYSPSQQNAIHYQHHPHMVPPHCLPPMQHHPMMNGYMHMPTDAGDWQQQTVANESTEMNLFSQANSGINFDKYNDIPVEVSGQDVPAPIDQFAEADLHPWIQENILRAGYTKPTPVQKNSIPTLLNGRDLMSCAQTGSGKTAAFLLPIINSILATGPDAVMRPSYNAQGRKCIFPSALVIAPTRELAMQIHKEADKFSYRTNILTSILYGGRENYRDQINRLRLGCHILIATPGRLIDIIEQGYIGLNGIKFLVLDEADRMLDMGFEPQIRKVISLSMPGKAERTTAMFSATFPKEIQVLAQDFLKENYVFLAVGRVGSTSDNIDQRIEWVEESDKRRILCRILEGLEVTVLVLTFVETKRGANELAWFLQRQGVRAVAIHGDLKQFERERNLEMFRKAQCNVLVATAVAARGLDIPNVRHVVNFDLPNDVDEYVHRIGRTGRCGNLGSATAFFNDKNRGIARDLQTLLVEANQEVPEFIRRCAVEGGVTRGSRGRFGGTDHRRGRGGGGGFGGASRGGAMMGSGFAAGFAAHSTPGGFGAMNGGFNGGAQRPSYQQVPQAQNGYAGFGNAMPPSFTPGQTGGAGGAAAGGGFAQSYRGFQSAQPNQFNGGFAAAVPPSNVRYAQFNGHSSGGGGFAGQQMRQAPQSAGGQPMTQFGVWGQ